jgi:hypothetical protein
MHKPGWRMRRRVFMPRQRKRVNAPSTTTAHKPRLTDADFARASAALAVDEPAMRAVTEVESLGSGFLATGEPKILFERHLFHRYTGGRYDRAFPDISNPAAGGYGAAERQHQRLERAVRLDREAALKSASWGLFQILGGNHYAAGHKTLQAFVNAMYAGEAQHLDAFVAFVRAHPPMHQALKDHDWAGFARRYNGPAYAKNQYDKKLASAYARNNRGRGNA